jgi:hypothetical protein
MLFGQGCRRHAVRRGLTERPATADNGPSSRKCRKAFFFTLILGRCDNFLYVIPDSCLCVS